MNLVKVGMCFTMALLMTACQNINGLSKKQINVLKSQGFTLNDGGWTLGLSEKLLFNVNESTIKPETYTKITQIGQQLSQVQITHLQLNGYTDNTGTAAYNNDLSLKRAQAVAEPLSKGGIPATNIKTAGLGPLHPIADNSTPEGRSENRRVAIMITPQ